MVGRNQTSLLNRTKCAQKYGWAKRGSTMRLLNGLGVAACGQIHNLPFQPTEGEK